MLLECVCVREIYFLKITIEKHSCSYKEYLFKIYPYIYVWLNILYQNIFQQNYIVMFWVRDMVGRGTTYRVLSGLAILGVVGWLLSDRLRASLAFLNSLPVDSSSPWSNTISTKLNRIAYWLLCFLSWFTELKALCRVQQSATVAVGTELSKPLTVMLEWHTFLSMVKEVLW